jgi:hypothetical protein
MSGTRNTFEDLPILAELRASLGDAFTVGARPQPAVQHGRSKRPSGFVAVIQFRSRRFALAAGAVASLAAVGVFGFQGGGVTPSAVAATMDHLAQAAAAQDWTGIPGPEEYLYTESRTAHLAAGNVAACLVSYDEVDRIWIATNGSGAISKSYSDVRFAPAAAHAACARHGQADPMSVADPSGAGRGTRFPAGGLSFPNKNWKFLSTDPGILLKQIHRPYRFQPVCRSAVRRERCEEVFCDHVWGWWTSGDADVDGKLLVEGRGEFGRVAEDVASEGAVTERGDQSWFGHRVVGGEEWSDHAGGDRSGDEQDVGVAG